MTHEEYLRKAYEAESKASAEINPTVRRTYQELAFAWRELARKIERTGVTSAQDH